MAWYSGPTLLEVLETVEIQRVVDAQPMRFPVQYVNRPNLDFRGYAGTLASGRVEVGQRVKVLPSGVESNVARIVTFDGDREEAFAGEAITLVLTDEIDHGGFPSGARGDEYDHSDEHGGQERTCRAASCRLSRGGSAGRSLGGVRRSV